MRGSSVHEDITLSSRYEFKYLIDPWLLPALRRFIRPFTEPDPFSARAPGLAYPICSLYLDSPDLALYRQTACGEKGRFKLRVRTYSDDPAEPAFFEVKTKDNSIVSKRRFRLERDEARAWLRPGSPRAVLAANDRRSAEAAFFWSRQSRLGARPVLRVRYRREAYESQAGDPVRITLDTELRHAVTPGDELGHTSGRWVRLPVGGAILEIKFTERFPSWVHELVRCLELRRQAVPKYGLCMEHVLEAGRVPQLSAAGFGLPPQGI